jgi:hypothetical protein
MKQQLPLHINNEHSVHFRAAVVFNRYNFDTLAQAAATLPSDLECDKRTN